MTDAESSLGTVGSLPAEPEPDSSPSAPPASFNEFPISEEVREAIAAMGYTTPTEVQRHVIRYALGGRDLVVQSKTGSGKTSAFGVPVIERVEAAAGQPNAPLALVMTPTRELAGQVAEELSALADKKGVRVLPVYGGVPMGKQLSVLRSGAEVVVGTPGRLLDHIRRGTMSLAQIKMVVLDEADEMLSMGFWDDVTDIIEKCPSTRQTMLFSATLPYEVAKAAAMYLREPARVDLSGDVLTVEGIDNIIINVVPDVPKPRQLLYLLETQRPASAICFCNTRNETEMIAKYLTQQGYVAEALTGNFRQKERERVMDRIKRGDLHIMVATDIASRGIDISNLSHVLNYSLPEFPEVYLHRVGRTGRIGRSGTAISLVDGRGLGTLSVLERRFTIKFNELVLPPEAEVIQLRSQRIMKELSEKASVAEVGQHLPVAEDILKAQDAAQVVAFLVKSYFNAQAEQGRRGNGHAQTAADAEPLPPRDGEARSEASESDGEHGQGEGGRRRRRRRRRGRGRGGDRGEQGGGRGELRGNDRGGRGGYGMDTMDAHEALAGEALPAAAAPVSLMEAPAAPSNGGGAAAPVAAAAEPVAMAPIENDGMTRLRVNIGFDDGFKGRGAVAKKICALAGLNDGFVQEIESRRNFTVLKAKPDIAEMLVDRVDGAQLGKKIIQVSPVGAAAPVAAQ